ncbi:MULTISPECIES: Slp family lipoprotein [Dyella]|uniref:Slp family lipoprotein n=1 Tax=Dyella TaxID=231454 RepID=UPI000C84A53D|nr:MULTISPECIES: Slp family lipoprotein [Dyella]MDR3446087.1 Slp family lipoprotein [Dyella sp.]PMQ03668.1 Outer membrane protein slp [Dyella sp. AD56]ULU27915.1 Slp family lipoprotein [Dyella terrae]
MSMYKPLILATAVATLAACATVPQPLQGTYTQVTSVSAQQESNGASGAQIRWGGQIIKTEPGPQETCFYVLQRPLDDQARPKEGSSDSETQGRFVACRAGFYDPEVFTRGRDITVVGVIQGNVSEKIGDYNYAYPRVEANVVYLWPKRVAVNYGPGWYDPYWGPYWGPGWGPWGPWGGWGAWGGYYPTRVIVRPPPSRR